MIGCFFLLSLPFNLSLKILQAYQRMYIAHISGFISYLLGLTGVIIGVSLRCTFLELLALVSFLSHLCPLACWLFIAKKFPWARFSWKHVNGLALKRLCSSSFFLLLYQLISITAFQMIPLLLASVANLKSVADFNILWRIFQLILLMAINISTASNPAIRDAFERGEIFWIRKMLLRVLFFQALLVLLSCLPLFFAGNFLIETWIRMPLEQPLGHMEWLVFALSLLLFVFSTALSSMLNFLDKTGFQILLSFTTGICLFCGIHLGVPKLGLIAIFVTLFVTSGISFVLSLRLLNHSLKPLVLHQLL
jgi:O-antigen/teichoic acid export membrane protein